MNAAVLFLDFDGVLHSEPSLSHEALTQLPLIESVLREFPAVEIVISSAWRLDRRGNADAFAVENLHRHFSPDIAARVVGVTPLLGRIPEDGLDTFPHVRELECCAWLKSNRPAGTRWMALDDRADYFSPDCLNLMKVDGGDGFMPSDQEVLRQHLTGTTTEPKHTVMR